MFSFLKITVFHFFFFLILLSLSLSHTRTLMHTHAHTHTYTHTHTHAFSLVLDFNLSLFLKCRENDYPMCYYVLKMKFYNDPNSLRSILANYFSSNVFISNNSEGKQNCRPLSLIQKCNSFFHYLNIKLILRLQ